MPLGRANTFWLRPDETGSGGIGTSSKLSPAPRPERVANQNESEQSDQARFHWAPP